MEVVYDTEFDPHGPHHSEEVDTVTSRAPTLESIPSQSLKKQKTNHPPQSNRRALIWDHYTISMVEGKDGKEEPQALCNYCKKTKYKAHPKYGTSNAKKHIDNCAAYKAFLVENPINGSNFDQKVFCKKFAEAIMYHSYPLSIVEHVKLRDMLTYLNPKVRHITRNTILRYCKFEHERLKLLLLNSLSEVNSRICFTCDCWSACTTRGFLTLTAHFVDNNWTLKSRILNFKYFPPPHRGVDIYLFVLGLIKDWKLEGKTFSMTCDNASAMDVMISRLKPDLHSFGPLPLSGRFFHVRCCAHILNLIVQSGMKVIDESVLKVREAVNYIAGSDSRLVTFEKCVVDVKSDFVGRLRLDCPTRWNSTYLMLKKALDAKDALNLFAIIDTSFKYGLSVEEWSIVDFVCKFLEPFYSITLMFSGSDYPTANLYFTNILTIEKLLVVGHNHMVPSIKSMATAMMDKFEKYWSEYSVILGIAVLLDPRYKMNLIKFALAKLYVPSEVELKVNVIYDAFVDLYKFYDQKSATSASTSVRSSSAQFSMCNILEDFKASNVSTKGAEFGVDAYLNSPLLPIISEIDFDILQHWHSQETAFPVIARMAKDILAIPITSVASESSFSMGGRVLTKYRSSLLTENVEAFVTTQNWLYGYLKEDEVHEAFEVMKEVMPNDIDFDSLPNS